MSPFETTWQVFLISIMVFRCTESSIMVHVPNTNDPCPNQKLKVHGGHLKIRGSMEYTVKCNDGFVTPLTSPNQSFVHRCENGSLAAKVPKACVAKRIAYEKIGFKMLFANMKEFWAGDLCADKQMQEKIVRKYNSSVVKLKKYKLYINSCSKIIPYHDYTEVEFLLVEVIHVNGSTEDMMKQYSKYVFIAFKKLLKVMSALGLFGSWNNLQTKLIFNKDLSIIKGYHCDSHLELRVHGGEQVCVGCGKGFWLDVKERKCHPCGPGFYVDDETAVACIPCPVQYTTGLWDARDIDQCFEQRQPVKTLNRLLETVVIPLSYMVILTIVVYFLNRFSLLRVETMTEPTKK